MGRSPIIWRIYIILLLLLAGCSPLAPLAAIEPTAIPTATLAPTAPPRATPTATASPTLTPTATATATPTPTAPPTPTPRPLEPTPTLAPLGQADRLAIFDQLWRLVDRRYLYQNFRGVDWQAVRAQYEPRVRDAATPAQFYGALREMVAELGDDHSRFESPQQVAEEAARTRGTLEYGGIGVTIRADGDGALITRLAPGGPADAAGLRARDVILAIDTIPFTDTLAFGPAGPEGAVRGLPGTTVRLTVRSPGAAPRMATLTRQVIPDDAFPPVTAQRLAGGQVGLLTIDTFERTDLLGQVRDQLDTLLKAGRMAGLLIDVRDNGGGFVHVMLDVLGLFVDGGSIGSTGGRRQRQDLAVPQGQVLPELVDVPIVVLTSADTVSAAEMFAAGMRVRGRARLLGATTAGNTENLLAHEFSDGSRLWLAELAYRLPDGSLLEGAGAAPDRAVGAEWWRFDTADDPQIQAAIQELRSMIK